MINAKTQVNKLTVGLLQASTAVTLMFMATVANAVDIALSTETSGVLEYLTDKNAQYSGPTVEDNIAKMDTDKNGFADVFEVRAYLVAIHGKDYQKDLLDKWEASASGKSCSTPFAKELYTDKNY